MLKFNNGKFKILLFGDIHESGDFETSPKFRDMQKLMIKALDGYQPDICVLLGDNCETPVLKNNPEHFKKMLSAVTEPITKRNIPAYCIMGNHEHDPGIDEEVLEAYQSIDGVVMRNDHPQDGKYCDYVDQVYSSDGKTPLVNLWFIDSNNLCSDRSLSTYDYVHDCQIKWFEDKSDELKSPNCCALPSYIFQHIPVPEEYKLLRKAKLFEIPKCVRGFDSKRNKLYVLGDNAEGYLGEGPCSPDINNGQFASWKKVGNVVAAFFGHDHLNDFSGWYDGVFMAQHKTAGFRAYTDGCQSCVRLVTIYEDRPTHFKQELKHFKEFGLVSESLGPVFKRITDRQSLLIHLGLKALGSAAGLAGAVAAVKYVKNTRNK
ncbi:MAG: metallophosphoesterase [Clostridiales bacterium]|nr:metallophosphoesterase [Clostridiales bacterium]